MEISEKIKNLRKDKGLSIKELSEKTGLSVGFISNLERNINSPSIANLQLICKVLDISLIDLLKEDKESVMTLKSEERKLLFTSNKEGTKYYNLIPDNSEINGSYVVINPKCTSENIRWSHSHDEIGIVIKGELEINLSNRKIYKLKEGDSIYIKKNTPHKYRNPGNIPAITHWFSIKK
ncbi:XRE family transcriptional regulator [uncultured Cetobacterium sp.]|uniref:helix-turn-helix domain-containing protein n=1 Tax=uncultured Cetobacterium sp. TaxID=527638 RepID=UPI002626B23A|nr:XRE family transcriptional regulator [uncultured Cetobacterium sp.]